MNHEYSQIIDLDPNRPNPLYNLIGSLSGTNQIGDQTGCVELHKSFSIRFPQGTVVVIKNAILVMVQGRMMLDSCAFTTVDRIGGAIEAHWHNDVSIIDYVLVDK